jgi:ribosome-binding protein aMBF1 (putative translation factor)
MSNYSGICPTCGKSFPIDHPNTIQRVWDFASIGKTRREVSIEMKISYQSVVNLCRKYGISFPRPARAKKIKQIKIKHPRTWILPCSLADLISKRTKRGCGIKWLATKIGCSRELAVHYEKGKCIPSETRQRAWAAALDIEIPQEVA